MRAEFGPIMKLDKVLYLALTLCVVIYVVCAYVSPVRDLDLITHGAVHMYNEKMVLAPERAYICSI